MPRPTLPPHRGLTLDQAQQELDKKLDDGGACPCCGMYAKVYKRKLNAGMAYSLVLTYRAWTARQPWVNVKKTLLARRYYTGDYVYLPHWGLLASAPPAIQKNGGGDGGLFSMTQDGLDFVESIITVPDAIYLFDGKLIGFGSGQIDIFTALGNKFDYEELMAAR